MSSRRDQRTLDLFDAPQTPKNPGALAGLKTQISHAMSAVIRDCILDRYEIASQMSRLLGEEVSKTMLDAYTAESRDDQNIPAYRFLAFILATQSFDALDELLRPLGCRLLVGEQRQLAAIAELTARRDRLDRAIRDAKRRLTGDGV
jgi:hypothetical protein